MFQTPARETSTVVHVKITSLTAPMPEMDNDGG